MIFSIFSRKAARLAQRKRDLARESQPADGVLSSADTVAATTLGIGPATVDARELARQTAAKIDAIESEMIHGRVTPAGPATRIARTGLAGTVFVPSGRVASVGAGVGAGAGVMSPTAMPAEGPAANAITIQVPSSGETLEVQREHAPRPDLEFSSSPGVMMSSAPGMGAESAQSLEVMPMGEGLAMDVLGSALAPALEEAAVLYSNGQADEAELILRGAVKDPSLGAQARHAWGMLFDLYQCRGRREAFDELALAFSTHFETSPPTWDDTLSAPSASAPGSTVPAVVALPALLDAQSIKQFEQLRRMAQRDRPVAIDLSTVTTVDPIGADLLLRVLAGFMKSARALVVMGAQPLLEVVAMTTEAGRRDPSDACWMLQLELLRLLGRQQEFEDLSIEYCVTYEVSPPSWEALPPSVQLASAKSARMTGEPQAGEAIVSTQDDGLTLSGELEGRIQDMVAALRAHAQHHALIQLDCARLRRIDFGAAGELLNEVVALQAAGKYLRFKDVNHLVAALMSVMGIPDLAEVSMRRL